MWDSELEAILVLMVSWKYLHFRLFVEEGLLLPTVLLLLFWPLGLLTITVVIFSSTINIRDYWDVAKVILRRMSVDISVYITKN